MKKNNHSLWRFNEWIVVSTYKGVGEAMIKAVIFDLDGTLLNRDASVRKFIDQSIRSIRKGI